jgi:hypothetical protein
MKCQQTEKETSLLRRHLTEEKRPAEEARRKPDKPQHAKQIALNSLAVIVR